MNDDETQRSGWRFDPLPPSGARQGGDPAQYVFTPDLSALVRETLQNSNDQLVPGGRCVEVTLREERFSGQRLKELQAAFHWRSLRTHLASAKVARPRFERGLELMDSDEVVGLWIEDRGTTGLEGKERGSGNFAALCRDRLFSEKQRAESGGSFGLGKAVLWRFSQLSTVAFYSRTAKGANEGRERFIIKATLPFHALTADQEFSGDGWFGAVQALPCGGGERAVSLWDDAARTAALRLGARPFRDGETGTSILIIGFDDPARDAAEKWETIETRLHEEARRAFWPALCRERLSVHVGRSPVKVDSGGVEASLASMLRIYDRGQETPALKDSEGVVVERVSVHLPAHKEGKHGAIVASADVIVQLAEENDGDSGALWCFRGPGMLITRHELRKVSLSARPFRAILVCGEAVRGNPDNAAELEAFLRTSEPPAHDQWTRTPRLKEVYRRGWGVALDQLKSAAEEAVRKHVVAPAKTSESGPDSLRRLFKVGTIGGGRSESEFHFRNLSAEIIDGAWHFRASVHPNLPTQRPWSTIIDVEFCEERGRSREGGTLAEVEVEGAEFEFVDGRAHIRAPAGAQAVKIRGSTDPQRHPVAIHEAAIDLVIRSRAEEGQ